MKSTASPENTPNSGSKSRRGARNVTEFASDDWCTPKWLADALGSFDLDPCSNPRSHIESIDVCSLETTLRSVGNDGLTLDWDSLSVFVNPPYSDVMPWARKLASHVGPWCALLKLDPTTKWWATLMTATPTIAPFRKRLKFDGDKSMTANFPSVLLFSAWRPSAALRPHLWLQTYAGAA